MAEQLRRSSEREDRPGGVADMAELVVMRGDTQSKHLLGEMVSIGRSLTCNVQLDDGYVSKVHSVITRKGADYFIRDLKSANKTKVNGAVVDNEVLLCDGDEIVFGNTAARFHAPLPTQLPAAQTQGQDARSDAGFETRFVASLDRFHPEKVIRNEGDLRRDYEKLRISYELSSALSGSLGFDAVLEGIVDTLIRLFGADRGVVLLGDAQQQLQPRCSRDASGHSSRVPYSNTIVNEAFNTRSSILAFDASIDARFAAAESVMAQGIRSSMAAPMLRGDETLGVIVLDSSMKVGVFTEKDLRILQTAANQAAVALHNSMLAKRLTDEAIVRQRFEKLVAPNLVERIISGELQVERTGRNRDVTILFSDIRGFTSFSETRRPEEIVAVLNDYFEEMVEVVFANEGTLDKFVGDEIMALFGAPVGHADDPVRALRTAIEMQQNLGRLNQVWREAGIPEFTVGIGINSGEVTAGFIGSSKALEYTVIGDVVNTAARFCSNAAPGEILVGVSTYLRVQDHFKFEALAPMQVKNKELPVQVYRVVY